MAYMTKKEYEKFLQEDQRRNMKKLESIMKKVNKLDKDFNELISYL